MKCSKCEVELNGVYDQDTDKAGNVVYKCASCSLLRPAPSQLDRIEGALKELRTTQLIEKAVARGIEAKLDKLSNYIFAKEVGNADNPTWQQELADTPFNSLPSSEANSAFCEMTKKAVDNLDGPVIPIEEKE